MGARPSASEEHEVAPHRLSAPRGAETVILVLIWKGHGYLVALFTFVASLLMELGVESVKHDDEYYQREALPLAAALAIAGVLSLVAGALLGRDGKVPLSRHSLFFIPVLAWGPILLVVAAGVYVVRSQHLVF